MLLKVLILSIILIAFLVLAMGVKLWLDPGTEFSSHSCSGDSADINEEGGCSACQIKELADCPEKQAIQKST